MIQVHSSGGGKQSTAISALICMGRLPKPDFVVIADTGREKRSTWEYMDAVTRPALKAIGVEVHRISKDEWAAPRGRGVFATSGQLLIPAFTTQNGRVSKLDAFCSGAWKSECVDRWLSKVHGITPSKRVKWIGFSADESRRVLRMQKGAEFKACQIRFPLVNDVPTTREGAGRIIAEIGWPEAPRSACYDCPNQSDYEWQAVQRNTPDDFQRAIERDEYIRTIDPHAFLHHSGKPLRQVQFTADDLFSDMTGCSSGECFL